MTWKNISSTLPKPMPNHTLFICKSCHLSEARPEEQPTDGTRLLDRLNQLNADRSHSTELEIPPVDCLWTCDRPYAIAFSAPHKPTYLFTNLPTEEAATALFEFSKRSLDSKTGDILWKQFPEALQSVSIAKIPAVGG
jgi:predicted metal-binding protein